MIYADLIKVKAIVASVLRDSNHGKCNIDQITQPL